MNEENKNPDTSGAPLPPLQTVENDMDPARNVVPSGPVPEKPARSFAKILLGVVIGTIVGIAILVALVIGGIAHLYSNVTSGCDKATKNMEQAEADLRDEAKQITVASKQLESVSVYANGDCLTGSGAVLDASVSMKGTVESARTATLQAFGLDAKSAVSMRGEMNSATHNGIERVEATVKNGEREYSFTYVLAAPASCPGVYTTANTCEYDPVSKQNATLLNNQIKSIRMTVMQQIVQQ